MIHNENHKPNDYSNNPKMWEEDKKVCIIVMILIGTGFTILYFTIGGGSK
jgi:hypothetical protein